MKIKKITKLRKEKTYDLNIEDNHNYFVTEDKILVHNSGKDPTKVDRSAAYATRYIAKNLVAAGVCDRVTIQIAYAIGVAKPVSIYVDTHGTATVQETEITECVKELFDLSPKGIMKELDLLRPIYRKTASYGHFGREDQDFPWEKLNRVADIKEYLQI